VKGEGDPSPNSVAAELNSPTTPVGGSAEVARTLDGEFEKADEGGRIGSSGGAAEIADDSATPREKLERKEQGSPADGNGRSARLQEKVKGEGDPSPNSVAAELNSPTTPVGGSAEVARTLRGLRQPASARKEGEKSPILTSFADKPLYSSVNVPTKQDIHQGNLGDCYFCCALHLIATFHSKALSDAIVETNEAGARSFTVRFYRGQRRHREKGNYVKTEKEDTTSITVNADFYCWSRRSRYDDRDPSYMKQVGEGAALDGLPPSRRPRQPHRRITPQGRDGCIWPMVLEKAWAVYQSDEKDKKCSYETIDPDYGTPAKVVRLASHQRQHARTCARASLPRAHACTHTRTHAHMRHFRTTCAKH